MAMLMKTGEVALSTPRCDNGPEIS